VNGLGGTSDFWRKQEYIARTGVPQERFETIVHPTASVSRMSTLGFGIVIFQNVTVTSNVRMGHHVMVLPNSVISHDSIIGDYTIITGGVCISGGVKVGQSCYLGTNCALKNGIEVGDHCLIGMGSVVLRDVPANSVMVGNPARFLRKTIETA
jgi:sugar O-acyltransferase (sialic acid O-acetyltransferase NeuD family)